MPVSTSVHITHCLSHIISLNPRSVLDVGLGFGLWGFLCREYLDVMNERVQPDTWQVRIDGIEFWEPYVLTHQRSLYSSIRIGDIRELAGGVDEYELIIAGDVIEHLHKEEGQAVLRALYAKATRAMLVNIPIGEGWEHPEAHGNPGELHRSQWSIEDFAEFAPQTTMFQLPCGKYGVFFCKKATSPTERAEALHDAAARCEAVGDIAGTRAYLEQAHAARPGDAGVAMHLADIALRQNDAAAAIQTLEGAVAADPTFHYGRLILARIFCALRRHDEARAHLAQLLAGTGVDADAQLEAERLLQQIRTAKGGDA